MVTLSMEMTSPGRKVEAIVLQIWRFEQPRQVSIVRRESVQRTVIEDRRIARSSNSRHDELQASAHSPRTRALREIRQNYGTGEMWGQSWPQWVGVNCTGSEARGTHTL